jgi:hypothetical protein
MATRKRKAPWDRPKPRRTKSTKLSAAARKRARSRARRAGRRYPNLVDNMIAAKKEKAAPKTRSTAKRPAARRRAPTKDPRGGLTAAGRREFARKDGARLKPGVKKRERDMTPEEMRRKGSWAARFYGRTTLPELVDANGKPTRFALSAAAWGEPVPRTAAAARRIAARGRRLLERYRKRKAGRRLTRT